MRILSLNAWGDCLDGVPEYLRKSSADIICLQEVHRTRDLQVPHRQMPKDPGSRTTPINAHLYDHLRNGLRETHDGMFAPQLHGLHDLERSEHPIEYGNAMFWSRQRTMVAFEQRVLYRTFNEINDGKPAAKSLQIATFERGERFLMVANYHGFWQDSQKGDSIERTLQFNAVMGALAAHKHNLGRRNVDVILIGDFNVTTDTEVVRSILRSRVFGPQGGVHLNSQFGVHDTRTVHYEKTVREADHAVVSPKLSVTRFWVDYEAPSDHAGMYLEIGE